MKKGLVIKAHFQHKIFVVGGKSQKYNEPAAWQSTGVAYCPVAVLSSIDCFHRVVPSSFTAGTTQHRRTLTCTLVYSKYIPKYSTMKKLVFGLFSSLLIRRCFYSTWQWSLFKAARWSVCLLTTWARALLTNFHWIFRKNRRNGMRNKKLDLRLIWIWNFFERFLYYGEKGTMLVKLLIKKAPKQKQGLLKSTLNISNSSIFYPKVIFFMHSVFSVFTNYCHI